MNTEHKHDRNESDESAKALSAEVEALRRKNHELLGENRQLKERLRDAQDALDATDSIKAELLDIKTKDAWQALMESTDVVDSGLKYLRQEMSESINFDDEGNLVFVDANGDPIPEVERLPNGLERETGRYLSPFNPSDAHEIVRPYKEKFPLFFLQPKGSGAPGSSSSFIRPADTDKKKDEKPTSGPALGLR